MSTTPARKKELLLQRYRAGLPMLSQEDQDTLLAIEHGKYGPIYSTVEDEKQAKEENARVTKERRLMEAALTFKAWKDDGII